MWNNIIAFGMDTGDRYDYHDNRRDITCFMQGLEPITEKKKPIFSYFQNWILKKKKIVKPLTETAIISSGFSLWFDASG